MRLMILVVFLFPLLTLAAPSDEVQPKTPDHLHFRFQPFPNTYEVHSGYLKFSKDMTQFINNTSVPQVFTKREQFPWPHRNPPADIRYGNPEIGYFSSKRARLEGGILFFDFVPPSYKNPIEFMAHMGSQAVSLGKRQYKSPLGDKFAPFVTVFAPLSVPFFLTDWLFHDDFGTVVNRLGEVVWVTRLPSRASNSTGFDITPEGDFIFLRADESTTLLRMTAFGQVKNSVDFSDPKVNLPSSHTVQYLKDTNEIVFLSYECRQLPWWKEFVPLFDGISGWLRLLTLPRRTYRSGRLIRMKLDDYSYKEIWNSYRTFSPDRDPNLATGYRAMADRFMDARSNDDYLAFLHENDFATWCTWPDKYANVEWTHENSAQYVPGKGYLISVRNLNEIIFVDEDGNTKWRMGEGKRGHDYWFERDGSSFSMQHAVSFLRDGRILLYDNNNPYRGFSGKRDGNLLKILNPQKPGPIKPDWTFDLWLPHSDVRGNAVELRNGHILAYTAGNPGVPSEILEIGLKDQRFYGHLQLRTHPIFKGFEIKPFYGFAGDEYLGETKNTQIFEQKPAEPFEFSY